MYNYVIWNNETNHSLQFIILQRDNEFSNETRSKNRIRAGIARIFLETQVDCSARNFASYERSCDS